MDADAIQVPGLEGNSRFEDTAEQEAGKADQCVLKNEIRRASALKAPALFFEQP
jgi:hypothetical protein